MALDFKRTQHHRRYKPKSRSTKSYKAFDGIHLPTHKLIGEKWVGNASWVTANMSKWLHSKVGKPVDMVYSEFLDMWNKSASDDYSPREYFNSYVSPSKDYIERYYWVRSTYYVSNGILCERKSKPEPWHKKPTWSKKQIEYNKEHCPPINISEDGPVFLGKLWARIPGYTRLVNVWVVSVRKFKGKNSWGTPYHISRKQKTFLEDFVQVSLAGIEEYKYFELSSLFPSNAVHCCYIAKLSDLK